MNAIRMLILTVASASLIGSAQAGNPPSYSGSSHHGQTYSQSYRPSYTPQHTSNQWSSYTNRSQYSYQTYQNYRTVPSYSTYSAYSSYSSYPLTYSRPYSTYGCYDR